ncbi:MAG: DUF4857 domain-containing protein [Lachnoclostridium sp.]|nr:DUF4857 domain-containing protein [Lachnoclostridium sp.]
MKSAYKIFLNALCIIVLSWFLPWLYSLSFPVVNRDPYLTYSPVANTMVLSYGKDSIFTIGADGKRSSEYLTEDQRDSLLPHLHSTQLMARDLMPDSVNGVELSVANIRHNAWTFSSLPRDINKVSADVYMMMESTPARIDLEDPKEVFRLDGKVEFVDIATNKVNTVRSSRFNDVFIDRGFEYPVKALMANVTSRKQYDEGYLMIDNKGDIFHLKQMAGRPYMVKVNKPDSIVAAHPFVMENIDHRELGLISDENHNLYALEREGYRLVHLPIGKVDPEKEKIFISKNIFNWIVKISDSEGARWIVLDSKDYSPVGRFEITYPVTPQAVIAGYIFPFSLSFTATTDCFAYPRLGSFSWHALALNLLLGLILLYVIRRQSVTEKSLKFAITLIFGIFAFIPFIIIRH